MKILLVKDDFKIGRFVEKGLQENTYTVVWRRSIEEANDAISESGFDLVIQDLGLPDGRHCRRRNWPGNASVKQTMKKLSGAPSFSGLDTRRWESTGTGSIC